MAMEKFNPLDRDKYKKVADLPKEQQRDFRDVEGGFVRASVGKYEGKIKSIPFANDADGMRKYADFAKHLRDEVRNRKIGISDDDLSKLVSYIIRW